MSLPEYPGATWVELPSSGGLRYSAGRSRGVKLSVTHATAGSETYTSAEDGAAYDRRRTDGTSTHCFHDANSTVQEVRTGDRAHHARFHGNEIGIGHELCGSANQTRAQWLDAMSLPTLRRAAAAQALDCVRFGLLPRRLTVAEVRAAYYSYGPGGICAHADVTAAFPEDQGDHTDPGAGFPWDVYLSMVRDEYDRLSGNSNGEDAEMDTFYLIDSADKAWDGKAFVSNRIHRREIRVIGRVFGPATSGANKLVLTDAMRATESWDAYLTAVAGPEFPDMSGLDPRHTHDVSVPSLSVGGTVSLSGSGSGATGPAKLSTP